MSLTGLPTSFKAHVDNHATNAGCRGAEANLRTFDVPDILRLEFLDVGTVRLTDQRLPVRPQATCRRSNPAKQALCAATAVLSSRAPLRTLRLRVCPLQP